MNRDHRSDSRPDSPQKGAERRTDVPRDPNENLEQWEQELRSGPNRLGDDGEPQQDAAPQH